MYDFEQTNHVSSLMQGANNGGFNMRAMHGYVHKASSDAHTAWGEARNGAHNAERFGHEASNDAHHAWNTGENVAHHAENDAHTAERYGNEADRDAHTAWNDGRTAVHEGERFGHEASNDAHHAWNTGENVAHHAENDAHRAENDAHKANEWGHNTYNKGRKFVEKAKQIPPSTFDSFADCTMAPPSASFDETGKRNIMDVPYKYEAEKKPNSTLSALVQALKPSIFCL